MNLLKKGIFSLLILGFITSCEENDDYKPNEGITGLGLTEITFSSFSADVVADANGVEDGTYLTVTPLAIGVDSYEIDFGAGGAPITISGDNGASASYDYSNSVAEATYTVTVTAKSNTLSSVSLSEDVTISHEVTAVSSAPSSPSVGLEEVLSIYSNGIWVNDAFISYRYSADGIDLANGAAQNSETTLDSGNKVLQYSRLSSDVSASIGLSNLVVADAFGSGTAATKIHFDVHSDFAVGVDKIKITLVNGTTEYVYNQDLIDGEWINLDLDLATDFSAPVVQFDEIKFELGAGGTVNDAATLNVDNVYLHKPITSVILNGDFTDKTDHWRFTTFTDGTTTPFGSSSDGSWNNIDGSNNAKKTAGARWTGSQSAGYLATKDSRYAYQALKLTPNTSYTLEYQYAIKNDSADEPIGGRRIVAVVLDGHYADGADAVANIGSNLANFAGTVSNGKFSDSNRETVMLNFTSNDSGEVAIMFYAVTPKDAYIDNVKVY